MSEQVIKNQSKGFGYTYNNLADLSKAGVEIPIMKTMRVDGEEYVFALVDGEWLQGAKVVEMEMKGMNAAQAYGAALTYARRYTVQLVKAIACDDDDKVEKDGEAKKKESQSRNHLDFDYIKSTLKTIKSEQELDNFGADIKKKNPNMTAAQAKAISSMFNGRREELR